ncbi:DMT family transporter [Rhizobium leucaenae]|uniref:Drug/metabolite transporter (DMT)-like permease n=2 Tax=Rhizobium leucaenae TaxID=29450 RepID=A0A7W7EJE2_9HYPH|nr:DMT family transporter [Rhizobium leucaenae]MBB4567720.1 drug/metabolite transporter (DMT)-like permease [Rhizobium leucaenae]MBB6301714.1 drug/metabolite transporter (DMT)-like permease [Rhizobium leucaenae]
MRAADLGARTNASRPAAGKVGSDDSKEFLFGVVAMLLAALAMSISPSLVRLADVGPFASAFWRVFLALPILWIWMRYAEIADVKAPRASFTIPTILAAMAFTGDLLFWHLAIMQTTIANATFFATMAPLWVVIFGWLLLRQRVDRATLVGLLVCLAGGAALVAQSLAFNPSRAVGDALAIITGAFFGLYFLAVGAARPKTNAARVTLELSIITAAILFFVAFFFEPRILPQSISGWCVLLALGLVSHAGGQGLLSVALGRLPTVFSSLVIFLESIAAALFAWFLFSENVTLIQALGGMVIVGGIWIARPRTP